MDQFSWNPAELLKLSGGYWSTCALHAGVKLDIFSHAGTIAEVACRTDGAFSTSAAARALMPSTSVRPIRN